MARSSTFNIAALSVAALILTSACGPDPTYTRCVEERKAYCNRLFACVMLGGLSVQVNFENESQCETQETKKCEQVTTANACPGGTSSSYSAAKHDQCISDQSSQSCASFANRPTSCSSYCCTTTDGGTC
ncbi:MAG: hypothetical protein QM817_33585 [Archangium sp.]